MKKDRISGVFGLLALHLGIPLRVLLPPAWTNFKKKVFPSLIGDTAGVLAVFFIRRGETSAIVFGVTCYILAGSLASSVYFLPKILHQHRKKKPTLS